MGGGGCFSVILLLSELEGFFPKNLQFDPPPYNYALISVLNDIIEFAFKGGNKKYIDFSENRAFWCHEPKHTHFFTKKWCRSGVFIVNFEHILHLVLVFLLLTLSM